MDTPEQTPAEPAAPPEYSGPQPTDPPTPAPGEEAAEVPPVLGGEQPAEPGDDEPTDDDADAEDAPA